MIEKRIGENVRTEFNVENLSDKPIFAEIIGFHIGPGGWDMEISVDSKEVTIPAGQTESFSGANSFEIGPISSQWPEGVYDTEILVTYQNPYTGKWKEVKKVKNNTFNVTMVGDHDISVDSLTIKKGDKIIGVDSDVTVYLYDNIKVTAILRNLGDFSESFIVKLKDKDNNIINSKTLTMGAGSSKDVIFNWLPDRDVSEYLKVEVDPIPGETNTSNNSITTQEIKVYSIRNLLSLYFANPGLYPSIKSDENVEDYVFIEFSNRSNDDLYGLRFQANLDGLQVITNTNGNTNDYVEFNPFGGGFIEQFSWKFNTGAASLRTMMVTIGNPGDEIVIIRNIQIGEPEEARPKVMEIKTDKSIKFGKETLRVDMRIKNDSGETKTVVIGCSIGYSLNQDGTWAGEWHDMDSYNDFEDNPLLYEPPGQGHGTWIALTLEPFQEGWAYRTFYLDPEKSSLKYWTDVAVTLKSSEGWPNPQQYEKIFLYSAFKIKIPDPHEMFVISKANLQIVQSGTGKTGFQGELSGVTQYFVKNDETWATCALQNDPSIVYNGEVFSHEVYQWNEFSQQWVRTAAPETWTVPDEGWIAIWWPARFYLGVRGLYRVNYYLDGEKANNIYFSIADTSKPSGETPGPIIQNATGDIGVISVDVKDLKSGKYYSNGNATLYGYDKIKFVGDIKLLNGTPGRIEVLFKKDNDIIEKKYVYVELGLGRQIEFDWTIPKPAGSEFNRLSMEITPLPGETNTLDNQESMVIQTYSMESALNLEWKYPDMYPSSSIPRNTTEYGWVRISSNLGVSIHDIYMNIDTDGMQITDRADGDMSNPNVKHYDEFHGTKSFWVEFNSGPTATTKTIRFTIGNEGDRKELTKTISIT